MALSLAGGGQEVEGGDSEASAGGGGASPQHPEFPELHPSQLQHLGTLTVLY